MTSQAEDNAVRPDIEALLERITDLEEDVEREKRSLLRRVGLWGGVVALFLSILTGGFTLWEKAIVDPTAKREAKSDALSEIVAQVEDLGEKAKGAILSGSTDITSFNTRALSLLTKADGIIKDYPKQVRIVDLAAIAFRNLQFERHQRAFDYAKLAYEKADSTFIKIDVLRVLVKALFSQSPIQDIPRARKFMFEALALSEQMDGPSKVKYLYAVYIDWVALEALFGECKDAKRLFDELKKRFESFQPKMPPELAQRDWKLIWNTLGQATFGSPCQIGATKPWKNTG